MRVKRYEAESMQEAIMRVRAELGRDAVILHSRKFRRGGAFGLFGRPMFEVIAAVELPETAGSAKPKAEEQAARITGRSEMAVGQSLAAPSPIRRVPAPEPVPVVEELPAGERRATAAVPMARPEVQVGRVTVPVSPVGGQPQVAAVPLRDPVPVPDGAAGTRAGLTEELAGLRRMIHELSSQLASKGAEVPVAPGWEAVRERLDRAGLLPEYLAELEAEVFRTCDLGELADEERVLGRARKYFLERFVVERRKAERPPGRRVVALVGPTGVGKTTTVAKLAAQFALFGDQSVGLLTVDTYRIAAVEQLKTYAEIINLPVEVAFSPDEVRRALERLADRDVILMDTAGRSQKNGAQMDELKAYLEAASPDEIHLVLSTTTKQHDLEDCLAQFRGTGYRRLIFTKLDETDAYGAIFNCAQAAKCPITYLTFGQNVPDDIEEASQDRLADLLVGTGAWKK